jgi:2-polyprenyl-3-methyl-5-hydroxy-6-metoxy-1,4-benzoquinol methylase
MNKKELLFYDAYEAFYAMAKESNAFHSFCKDAFGEDFSQDGFSNKEQIDMILQYIPPNDDVHILDIGCGNGKMLVYLQKKTKSFIYGFDYSEEAIKTAQFIFHENAEFREGIIGNIEYPDEKFDMIISMDTLYFAPDMTAFVAQVKKWMKKDGVFFVGYQEGEIIPKNPNAHTTMLVKALQENDMTYEVIDISQQTYELLKRKQKIAMKYQSMFEAEGNSQWFDMLISQTEYINESFDQFKEKMARYIYVIRKLTN